MQWFLLFNIQPINRPYNHQFSIHLPDHWFSHLSVQSSTHPSIYSTMNTIPQPSVHLSTCPAIHSSTHSLNNSSTYKSINAPSHPSIHPFIHPCIPTFSLPYYSFPSHHILNPVKHCSNHHLYTGAWHSHGEEVESNVSNGLVSVHSSFGR